MSEENSDCLTMINPDNVPVPIVVLPLDLDRYSADLPIAVIFYVVSFKVSLRSSSVPEDNSKISPIFNPF